MARIARKWTWLLSVAAAVIAFVFLAFEFVAVDADAEPPVVVSTQMSGAG